MTKTEYDELIQLFTYGKKAKPRQGQQHFIDYIFRNSDPAAQEDKIANIMAALEGIYELDRNTEPIIINFVRRIAAELASHRFLKTFLRAFEIDRDTITIQDRILQSFTKLTDFLNLSDNKQSETGQEDENPFNHLKAIGRRWFINIFFRYVGESIDRSINFSLFLQEQIARSAQNYASGALTFPKNNPGVMAYLIILMTVLNPTDKDIPIKNWLIQLIKHARDNQAADECLESVLNISVLGNARNHLPIVIVEPRTPAMFSLIMKLLNFQSPVAFMRNPFLTLTQEQYEILHPWTAINDQKREQNHQKGNQILEWYSTHRVILTQRYQDACKAISENPRRGLRPDGWDHYDITVAPLRHIGVESIIFFSEGSTFPDITVELLVRKETPHRIKFRGQIRNFRLDISDEVLYNAFYTDYDLLTSLLEYIIIDILHRVIVEGRELKKKKSKHKRKDSDESKAIPVRPHFRSLPKGHQASHGAYMQAIEEKGFKNLIQKTSQLPEGKTFVSAYYTGGRMKYDLPTEPIGVYGDEDLLEGVET